MYGGYAPYQQMGQPDPYAPYGYAPQYGSFWARLAAGLADGTLMFILLIFLVIVRRPASPTSLAPTRAPSPTLQGCGPSSSWPCGC